ncbi:MAG: succinylglutamate desuccinylase/aspartoacylase family protein [Pseudomonadota bacterium]
MTHEIEHVAIKSGSVGTRRELIVHHFGNKERRPKAYFHACLHADEVPATAVASFLVDLLDDLDSQGNVKGHVVVVPVANPIGLDQTINGATLGRFNLNSRKNFNRGFPYVGDAVLRELGDSVSSSDDDREKIRHALVTYISNLPKASEEDELKGALLARAADADFVFDMHCTGEAPLHGFAWHGSQPEFHQTIADLGLSALFENRNSGAGSFEDACADLWDKLGGPLGCQPVCLEYRGKSEVSKALALSDAERLVRMLGVLGVLDTQDLNERNDSCERLPAHGFNDYFSPASGLVFNTVEVGKWVAQGELIATIKDPLGLDNPSYVEVRAGIDGYFLQREDVHMVQKGDLLGTIVSPNPTLKEGENPFDD